jgi:hypothetical protein
MKVLIVDLPCGPGTAQFRSIACGSSLVAKIFDYASEQVPAS